MKKNANILIIGAGPSGLALAMELCRYGFTSVKIVEKLPSLTTRGKALAIAPNTLDILEPSGSTSEILKRARKIFQFTLARGNKQRTFTLGRSRSNYNYLATLEQEQIEACLIKRLKVYGGKVDRGVEMVALDPKKRVATLRKGKKTTEYKYDLLVGADGVYSPTRQFMDFDFEGVDESEEWEQMEIAVTSNTEELHPVVFLDARPVIAAIPTESEVLRVVTPGQDVLKRFKKHYKKGLDVTLGKVIWKSEFRVGYRSSVEMFEDHVVLIGDAANVHSPVGGRGMNKGVEDAVELARAMHEGQDLNVWEKRRRKIDGRIVRRVQFASRIIRSTGWFGRSIRAAMFYVAPLFRVIIVRSVLQ